MPKCPGQDRLFWKPEDIYDVACPVCDAPVEFLKTDPRRPCQSCGHVFRNPRIELGCGQWCTHAEECLGYVPDEAGTIVERGPLASNLIAAVKEEFGGDYRRIAHALTVHDYAHEILRAEEGDPRVVTAAALLHDIGILEAERRHGSSAAEFQELEGPPIARRIIEKLGLDERTIEHVCRIVGTHHSGGDLDTPEFRVVWDADLLVNAEEAAREAEDRRPPASITEHFRTKTGREKAERLVLKGVAA
jgi:hypothetical protein